MQRLCHHGEALWSEVLYKAEEQRLVLNRSRIPGPGIDHLTWFALFACDQCTTPLQLSHKPTLSMHGIRPILDGPTFSLVRLWQSQFNRRWNSILSWHFRP